MSHLYLDHNATTPLDPAVRDEMLRWLGDTPRNASSVHALGQEARRAIDQARVRVARLVGAQPEEIVFTSGGTEASNLAIFGALAAAGGAPGGVVTSAVEHQAVLNPCLHVRAQGGQVALAPVDPEGQLDADALLDAVGDHTRLVSVMLANNDVGTLQPVGALSGPLRARGVLLHTDAVQAAGKVPVDVGELGVDLLSFSGHKLHGPQGVGALVVRRGTLLSPIQFGGHQERRLRPGTENVAAIAGFGKACELARERLVADRAHILALRARFEDGIRARIAGIGIHGEGAPRLPNTTNVSFDGLDGEALVIHLDLLGLAASTGAACSSVRDAPSHVLLAMGRSVAQARSSVRFSLGRGNTPEQVTRAVDIVVEAVGRMREHRR